MAHGLKKRARNHEIKVERIYPFSRRNPANREGESGVMRMGNFVILGSFLRSMGRVTRQIEALGEYYKSGQSDFPNSNRLHGK